MKDLLEEIMENLSALLQSGFASAPPSLSDNLKRLAVRCEDTGLHTGAKLVQQTADLLAARSHAFEKDDSALSDTVCRTVRYVRLCIRRLDTINVSRRWENLEHLEEHQ